MGSSLEEASRNMHEMLQKNLTKQQKRRRTRSITLTITTLGASRLWTILRLRCPTILLTPLATSSSMFQGLSIKMDWKT